MRLASSRGIEITPKTGGVVPVTVSGDSGVKLNGFFDPHLNLTREGSRIVINGPVFIAESLNYESSSNITLHQNISQVITTINITSIIDQVNSSDRSPEEKEMIKQILELLNSERTTKPLPGILTLT